MINVRLQEASEYRHAKKQRAKTRLLEKTLQVKIASNKELDDFREYLKHKYDHIHVQIC